MGEEVDGEPRVPGVVQWEHPIPIGLLLSRISEPFCHLLQSQDLLDLLQNDLQEDTATTGRIVLVQLDHFKDGPAYGIGGQLVSEETANVSETVGLVSMDGIVIGLEGLFETFSPGRIRLVTESLSHQTVELGVGSLLRATLDNHVAEFDLAFQDDQHNTEETQWQGGGLTS